MSWVAQTLNSTIGRKLIVALTGLFLCTFLIVHAGGNTLLFRGDGGRAFNEYTYFMTHNPLIKTVSYLLYTSILAHVVYTLILTVYNGKARSSSYAYSKPSANSTWASRNMGFLGTVLLIFLVIHMKTFWYEMHFGNVPIVSYEGQEYKDLYSVVNWAFAQPFYTGFYVLSMAALAFHLVHGFRSGFQTLGANHPKYNPLLSKLSWAFGVIIPIVFAAMPIYVFVKSLG